jgi:[acyl-carrier-protein] S-malonyltransferase
VIECAPSKTLIGMAKRIDPVLAGEALVDQAALERVLALVKA